MKLLTVNNAKTVKGENLGWVTGILHLAPAKVSGYQVCPNSTAGCRAACLNTAGRGTWHSIQDARIRKTKWLFEDREGFIEQLHKDIETLKRTAANRNMRPAVRLNGTSDIPWEIKEFGAVPQAHPDIQFYGYTKNPWRVISKKRPENYYLIFSRTSKNEATCLKILEKGHNVAVVFTTVVPGTQYLGHTVINGDEHDLRFIDDSPCIVGLKAKGKARKTKSKFVVREYDETINIPSIRV